MGRGSNSNGPRAVKGPEVQDADKTPEWDVWAKYYDLMDGDRKPMVAFYQSLVKDNVKAILELGSGTGTVASALANVNTDVTVVGIDESPRMIEAARTRDSRCTWILGDMKNPPVDGPFDLVICCYNSVQHMLSDAEILQLFGSAQRLLGPHAAFAFDLYEPNAEYLNANHVNRLVRAAVDTDGHRLEIRENTGYDSPSRIYTLDWRLVKEGCDQPIARLHYRYRQYTSAQIDNLLARAGLRVLERYGDFARSPAGNKASKQVVIAGR